MSAGKTGQQKFAEGYTNTSVANQQNAQQQQGGLSQAAQGTDAQFEGPVQQSPFYKALLNTGISSTSNAYQNADTNLKQDAQKAGFGYNQPVTQGAEGQLQSQEASALAQVPNQATVEATGPALQAAGQSAGQAATYGGEGVQYGNQVLDANQQAANLQAARQKQQQSLWNSIAGAESNIIGAASGAGG